jgi:hypothetical protein
VTEEAKAHLLANLEMQLRSIESQRARNNAEALEILDRAHEIRRDIERGLLGIAFGFVGSGSLVGDG